jgi:hypothetical protein
MKFVNTQSRIIYNSAIGKVNPGATTIDKYKDLEKCLQNIIDICGRNFRVVLNEKEAQLIAKLMELDEAGVKFDPSVIPLDVRRDPTGIKRLIEADRQKQHARNEAVARVNKAAAVREAMINGEVADKPKKIIPLGVDRSAEVEEVANKSMSGFEQILAENARIAEQQAQQPTTEPKEPQEEPNELQEEPIPPPKPIGETTEAPAQQQSESEAEDGPKAAKKPVGKAKGRGKVKADAKKN